LPRCAEHLVEDLILVLEYLDHDLGTDWLGVGQPEPVELLDVGEDHHLIPLILALFGIFFGEDQPLPHVQLEELQNRLKAPSSRLVDLLLVVAQYLFVNLEFLHVLPAELAGLQCQPFELGERQLVVALVDGLYCLICKIL
jgi:hypothetical protein